MEDHTIKKQKNERIRKLLTSAIWAYHQNPIIQINYEFTDWENLVDPDNKLRNLKEEKEFKIKNWYGDTINYLNNNYSGKILDIGPGLGFFLSALNSKKWEKRVL